MYNFVCPYSEFLAVQPFYTLEDSAKAYAYELAQELGTSENMTACALISMFSAVQNGAKCFLSNNYHVPSSLYIAVGAPPSAGKTPIVERMLPVLMHIINKHILLDTREERMRNAKILVIKQSIKNLVKKAGKFFDSESHACNAAQLSRLMNELESIKIPCSPMMGDMSIPAYTKELCIRDGSGICIDAEGGILSQLDTVSPSKLSPLLKAWSGETIVDITKKAQIRIENPSMVMMLMWQIEPLFRVVKNPNYRGIGLIARFLIHAELNWLPKNGYGRVSEISEKWYAHRMEEVFVRTGKSKSQTGKPLLFSLSNAAHQTLNRFKEYLSLMQGKGQLLYDFQDIAGKLDQQAVRIAMSLHAMNLSDLDNFIIEESTMLRACRLAIYFAINSVNFIVYGSRNKIIEEAKPLILNIVQFQSQAGFNVPFCVDDFRRVNGFSKSKCDRILFWMVENKWLSRQIMSRDLPSGEKEQYELWLPIVDFSTVN